MTALYDPPQITRADYENADEEDDEPAGAAEASEERRPMLDNFGIDDSAASPAARYPPAGVSRAARTGMPNGAPGPMGGALWWLRQVRRGSCPGRQRSPSGHAH